jgi:hypothetical protein
MVRGWSVVGQFVVGCGRSAFPVSVETRGVLALLPGLEPPIHLVFPCHIETETTL